MLLKSIKLHNFRQFKEEILEFASGEDGRNVTLVLGENGTGKTRFGSRCKKIQKLSRWVNRHHQETRLIMHCIT